MNTKKPKNSYDETKKMLNVIRKIQSSTKPQYGLIGEQRQSYADEDAEATHWELERDARSDEGGSYTDDQGNNDPVQDPTIKTTPGDEDSDFAVINDVEVVIHSEDPEDLELNDEEKGQISQLIDDFRSEVMETVQFDKLDIYETSAKLGGKIGEIGLMFTLSTGDDTGLYISGQMLKIDENSLMIFEKLGAYQLKFSSTINDLLVRRRTT